MVLALFMVTDGFLYEKLTDLSDFITSLEVLLLIGIVVVFSALRFRLETLIF